MKQRIRRGRQAFDRRDYVAALEAFEGVLEARPEFADIRHLAGLCLSYLGDPEAALGEFERAVELNDCYVEAQLHRGITLNELGRYEEAERAVARAQECDEAGPGRFPTMVSARLANAHADVGDLYMQAGAPSEAVVQYRAATELRPAFLDIRHKLAQALMHLGELDDAADELASILDSNARFFEARMNLGLVHYRRGELDRAEEHWDRCRASRPDAPQLRAYLAMLEQASTPHEPAGGDDE